MRDRIKRSETVTRSVRDRMLFGVCGGLAQHFGISSLWIRLGFVLGFFFTQGLALLLYIICIFIIPREEGQVRGHCGPRERGSRRPTRRFADQRQALEELHRQFDEIDRKVRGMEDYVTSKEYVLKRKFENL